MTFLIPMVQFMFGGCGRGGRKGDWRCIDSVYYYANEKNNEKEFFKTSMYPPHAPPPTMPFIYVNIIRIAYPVCSHSPRIENACRELNIEISSHVRKNGRWHIPCAELKLDLGLVSLRKMMLCKSERLSVHGML